MYGITGLKKGGGPPGSGPPGSAKHAGYKGSYKTGSRKGTAAGDKGDKKSQAQTARELDQLIIGGDVTRGGKAFLSGKISAAERRQQLLDLAKRARGKGIPFALNPEEFTGNLRGLSNQAKIGKLRGDMSPSDYHNYMSMLHGANPAAMEKAFPWGSGAALRGLANLAVPAPLKMLGSMVGDLGTAAKQFIPKQIREDMGPGVQKIWEELKGVPKGLARHGKALLTGKLDQNLDQTQKANLGIIKDEETTAQADLIEGEKTLEDTHDAILEDLLGSLDTSQDIAYDPTRPINYASEASGKPPNKNPFSPGDELDNLLIENELDNMLKATREYPYNFPADPDYWDPSKKSELWEAPENVEENIFDPLQNVMPNVPVTMDHKKDFINQIMGWDASRMDEDSEFYDPEYINQTYNRLKKKTDQGWEYGPFEGVINKPNLPFVGRGDHGYRDKRWQYPGTDELVDQIEWNTANRPLDWSGGETPELTEDFIKENIITDLDWGFDQGGYLKKYDDGGYANMSTFEKLKAINDSIAEG